jgi:hypothetical protein
VAGFLALRLPHKYSKRFDLDVFLVTPARRPGIATGYRTLDVYGDYQLDFVRLRIHGSVGASLRF